MAQNGDQRCLTICSTCSGSGWVRDNAAYGAIMHARRKAARLKLRELADKTGLSISYLSDLEHGRKKWRSGLILTYAEALESQADG